MKPAKPVSEKHGIVTKNAARINVAVAIAAALAMFTIVGGHAMLSRMSYQRRVTAQQNQAIQQLKDDQTALNSLVTQYQVFNNANPNMLGVASTGTTGDQGSNARLVLDALPSQYDFPALTSSIEKLLAGRGITPQSINGTDATSTNNVSPSSPNPQPQPMQFTFTITSSYDNVKALLNDFQRSIRPFKVITLDISGSNNNLTVNATFETYYQPTKVLNISNKEVK